MKNILEIKTIADYFKLRNCEVLHPLVGIVDFDNVSKSGYTNMSYDGFHYSCYAIFLKDAVGCKLMYGGNLAGSPQIMFPKAMHYSFTQTYYWALIWLKRFRSLISLPILVMKLCIYRLKNEK